MRYICRASLVVAALILITGGVAFADTIVSYTVCTSTCASGGTIIATFGLPSGTLQPQTSNVGVVFTILPTNLMINGAPSTDFLAFYNSAHLGGFGAFSSGSSFDLNLIGPQLFSGPENAPMILTGSFSLFDFSGHPFNFVADSVSTPEPSTLVSLTFGLLALVIVASRFKSNRAISASQA